MKVVCNSTSVPMSELDAAIIFRTNGKTEIFLAGPEDGKITEESPEFAAAVAMKLFTNDKARMVAGLMVTIELELARREAGEADLAD